MTEELAQAILAKAKADRDIWLPIMLLLPHALIGEFMYMGIPEQQNPKGLFPYKHRLTRRYLWLNAEGKPYAYNRNLSMYQPVTPEAALMEVFEGIDQFGDPEVNPSLRYFQELAAA